MSSIRYDRTVPYNNLPLLPPSNDILTSEVWQAVNEANKQLYLLKGKAEGLPNQSMLVNTILLRESKASSEIENIFTTNEELYKATSGDDKSLKGNVKEVLRYRQALWSGYNHIKNNGKFTIDSFVKIYREIKQAEDGIRSSPVDSTRILRRVFSSGIGEIIYSPRVEHVIYTPPRGEKIIKEKLTNLVEYINNDKKYNYDPLIKLAIAHYQFEAIHPFYDGNGRTGRISNILLMVQKHLLDVPILYLSAYIIENKDEYYDYLNAVTTRGNWTDWILYMMKAIEETSAYTIRKINEINQLFTRTTEILKANLPRIDKEIVSRIFEQPYVIPSSIVGGKIKSINTVKKYLQKMEELKLLTPVKIGAKNAYLNTPLFHLLSET